MDHIHHPDMMTVTFTYNLPDAMYINLNTHTYTNTKPNVVYWGGSCSRKKRTLMEKLVIKWQ